MAPDDKRARTRADMHAVKHAGKHADMLSDIHADIHDDHVQGKHANQYPTKPFSGKLALCVSIHDVAPATWSDCLRLLDAVRAVADIPVTWLVVPRYHDSPAQSASCESMLSDLLTQGHELALHGYTHLDPAPSGLSLRDYLMRRVYTQREGEFAAIGAAEARSRIELGLKWFSARGWNPAGFVAPAWLMGGEAWQALAEFPFAYTTTYRHFHLLPRDRGRGASSVGVAHVPTPTESLHRHPIQHVLYGPQLMHLPDSSDLLNPRNLCRFPDLQNPVQTPMSTGLAHSPHQPHQAHQPHQPHQAHQAHQPHQTHPPDQPHQPHQPNQPLLPHPTSDNLPSSQSEHMIHAPALVYSTRNRAGRVLSPYAVTLLARCMERAPLIRLALHPRDAQHPALIRHMQTLLAELLHTHAPMTKITFATRMATNTAPSVPPMPSAGDHTLHSTKDGRCAPLLP